MTTGGEPHCSVNLPLSRFVTAFDAVGSAAAAVGSGGCMCCCRWWLTLLPLLLLDGRVEDEDEDDGAEGWSNVVFVAC